MQIAFTPGDKCEKEAKVLLCILGFAYFKKGEVSFHFKDYACERGEWITSYSELARRTGLIRRAAVTAVGHLVEAGWLTVTAVGRMTKFASPARRPRLSAGGRRRRFVACDSPLHVPERDGL